MLLRPAFGLASPYLHHFFSRYLASLQHLSEQRDKLFFGQHGGAASPGAAATGAKPTANNDFVLRISWSSDRYETAEVGQFEVTDVTFTEDTTWTTCTVDDDFHTIGAGGFQYKFRGQTTARYKTGTGTTINNPLDIEITNGINADHDFQTLSPVVQLTAGNKYRLTYNVENLGTAAAQDLGANVYAVAVNASNDADIASTSPVAVTHGNDVDIVLDFIAPASGSVYFKLNSSYTPATELVLTPSYADITPSGYTSVVGDGTFHAIGNNGFQYMFASGEYVKYKGGTSFNDPLDAWVTIPLGTDHDFQTKTPVASVSAGHFYKLTYNVNNIGDKDTCDTAQIYAEVCNASNDASLATSWDNKIKVNAGDDADIELEFMAPSSGQVYVKLNSSYTWSTELVLTPELVDQSPGFSACTTDDWTFAGSNNTGWQYYVASPGSAYNGGTNLGDDLVVNYNDYMPNRDHSLMARSPITQVDSAKTYTGSISIKNGSSTALAANNVSVSVHWYNAQTGDDGAIEGTVQSGAIAAGATGTFNFSYTAPDSGYIFYEASTSYTPEKSQYTFSATHTPPADGRYDVAIYKSGDTPTYPTKSDKIFAGWFDDVNHTAFEAQVDLQAAGEFVARLETQAGVAVMEPVAGLAARAFRARNDAVVGRYEVFVAGTPGVEGDVREKAGAQADMTRAGLQGPGGEDRNVDAPETHVGQVVDGAFVPEYESEILVRGHVASVLQAEDGLDFDGELPGQMIIDEAAQLDAEAGIGGQAGLGDIHVLAGVVGLQQHAEADRPDLQTVCILGAQARQEERRSEEEKYDLFHGNVH